MKCFLATALLGAASAAPAVLNLQSPLNSEIRMGNARIQGFCADDVQPAWTYMEPPANAFAGQSHTITIELDNIKESCGSLAGTKPCAADGGYAHPNFWCQFTNSQSGAVHHTGPYQAYRDIDSVSGTPLGIRLYMTCETPAFDQDHTTDDRTFKVDVLHGWQKEVTLSYTGKAGGDSFTTDATAYPTAYPTSSPTNPTSFPTPFPTPQPNFFACNGHSGNDCSCAHRNNHYDVQCCSGGSGNRNGCTRGTLAHAESHCANMGMHVCTRNDVQNGKGRSSGCGYDSTRVWTSSQC